MNNPLKYTDPTGKDVSIGLRFTGAGWTEDEKRKIIAQITGWYQNQNIGKVFVFDSAKASHGGNFFTRMFGGYTSIAVSSASGGKHTYSTVWAGNYSKLPLQQRLNAISNTIIHETVAHHFGATLLQREDYVKYNRELGWGYYDAIRSRYGTVADSYAFADPATRRSMTDGPIPIHPGDLRKLQDILGPEDVEPPDYDN